MFKFFFLLISEKGTSRNGSGYFLVDPTLQLGPSQEEVELDGIVCQTVITKLLGPFDKWLSRLQVTNKS